MSTTTDKRRAGRKSTPSSRLVTAAPLPQDEQALLTAYRAMDDRARRQTLGVSVRFAVEFPAPAQRGPRLMAMPAAALPLLHSFSWMSESAQRDLCFMAEAIAKDEATRLERQPLRLVIGGKP